MEAVCAALGIQVRELFAEAGTPRKPISPVVRCVEREITGLRSRLTPCEREQAVTVVIGDETSLEVAIARALALAVEGEIVQVALDRGGHP
jgi:hypothetical protein